MVGAARDDKPVQAGIHTSAAQSENENEPLAACAAGKGGKKLGRTKSAAQHV
jgi:hypothetical protein